MNSANTFYLCIHCLTLFEPLLTKEGLSHAAWASLKKHREVVVLVLSHAAYRSDGDLLDKLIDEHADLWEKVDEYKGFDRPKHHFQAHLRDALWRHGPWRHAARLVDFDEVRLRSPKRDCDEARAREGRVK